MHATHYDLACIYAFWGDHELAFTYLEIIINNKNFIPPWWIVLFRVDPFFDSIRDEGRYKAIVKNLEEKYQKEHKRFQIWLNEDGYL